jgi:hypothetical protein
MNAVQLEMSRDHRPHQALVLGVIGGLPGTVTGR